LKEINHLNYFGFGDTIYCERNRDVIYDNAREFLARECPQCPFFRGHLQGEGVECFYADSTAGPDDFIITEDSPERMRFRRMVLTPEERAYRKKVFTEALK